MGAAPTGGQVGLVLVAFAAPLQLLTSVIGFLARDIVAGTGMGVLAGTWSATGLVLLTSAPGSTSDALGLLLMVSALAIAVACAGAVSSKAVPAAVLATTVLRFAATGVYELSGSDWWKSAAGWIGVVLAALAAYTSLALLLEDAHHRTRLPLGRRGDEASALREGSSDEATLWQEAGIRNQL
ncbi:MAG: hypothetical protein M3Y51_04780 [Actinomycetota bacterium]|nr:hypothetical protein [Actinomycetota bacterium]